MSDSPSPTVTELTFAPSLRSALADRLSAFDRRSITPDDRTRAAVALVVLPDDDRRASVVLTRRARGLRRHGGQWALPGGRCDLGETAEETARRELHEEVGLDLPSDTVLGHLDDYPTRSGFVVTPVVLWAPGAMELRPDPGEVAAVYRVTLEDLSRPRAAVRLPGGLLALSILKTLIFAPTAAILHQLAEVGVHGRSTRVDHFEQPRFAWR